MSAYKTPGVYVEEIVKFPPSVAQVETAIPAFIGYTEKAIKKQDGDLILKPTRITSLLEYEIFFGKPKKEDKISVTVVDGVVSAIPPKVDERSPFLMYYSMQMYFANGGGPCYIVSVGDYTGAVELGKLTDGLDKIKKVDEPTLLVFPDATSLPSDSDFYGLYNRALMQCNDLQDRFTIIDTYKSSDVADDSQLLRDTISLGKDYLKYGASYYPFLDTILDYHYDEAVISVDITATKGLKKIVEDIAASIDRKKLGDGKSGLAKLESEVDKAADVATVLPKVKAQLEQIKTYVSLLKTKFNEAVAVAELDSDAVTETKDLDKWVNDNLNKKETALDSAISSLVPSMKKTAVKKVVTDEKAATDTFIATLDKVIDSGELKVLINKLPELKKITAAKKLAELAKTNNALYNKVKAEIGLLPITLPPSSTMAGIYARVDSDRGVWKAPANVGLNYVMKPSVQISHDEQKDLNVDTVGGKSINAIRTFVGKGNLVWGARTLAGNDNEWRYVSVRRFFNMAEESIKKATEQFVFEPNDKNTWVRVKAMIDNFLTLQWKAGALVGTTPDNAFYVKIGIGETMTAQDILEGSMIVEIGMAVVRPAEFIVLKFSHKMQEA